MTSVSGSRLPTYDGWSTKPAQEMGTAVSLGCGVGLGLGTGCGSGDAVDVGPLPPPHAWTHTTKLTASTPTANLSGRQVIEPEGNHSARAVRKMRMFYSGTLRPRKVRRTPGISCEAPKLTRLRQLHPLVIRLVALGALGKKELEERLLQGLWLLDPWPMSAAVQPYETTALEQLLVL